MPDSSKSRLETVVPLSIKDVTATSIANLRIVPGERLKEGTNIPESLKKIANAIVPQKEDGFFSNLYVTSDLIKAGKLEVMYRELFPNYQGYIYEIEDNGKKQLILVCISSDLEIDIANEYPRSFPFLFYIPPSPQDTPGDHRKLYPNLYKDVKDKDIPLFYKKITNYPYEWDWLFFQIVLNVYRFSFQLKMAQKPFAVVVPVIKSFEDGLNILSSAITLEKCLMGIQKFVLDNRIGKDKYYLPDLRHVTLASFSIGNNILSRFITINREVQFFRNKVKSFIILDPPFKNVNNRSPIINVLASILKAQPTKSIFLYTQDKYYIQPLIQNFLTPKGLTIDLNREKIFSNPALPNIYFALIEPESFLQAWMDAFFKNVHQTFPNFFINHAISRSALQFKEFNGKKYPDYP